MSRFFLMLLFFTVLLSVCCESAVGQGLLFHGNEADIANRSGLVVPEPDSKMAGVDKLSVRFSLRVNNISSSGFIFGIKDCTSGKMLNMMMRYRVNEDSVQISFNKEGERQLCQMACSVTDLLRGKTDVEVKVDSEGDCGMLSIGGREIPFSGIGLSKEGDFVPQVNFGLTRHIVETASVTVADLEIERDGEISVIPLNESGGDRVHDSSGHVVGRVHNPQWQINKAYYWRKLAEFSSPTPTGCAFDGVTRRFYSYNSDSITIYDDVSATIVRTALNNVDKSMGSGKLPTRHGMNLFSQKTGRIYPYEIYYDNFSGVIDPATGDWRRLAVTEDDKAIHHHAHILCANDSSVLLFGGYGDRKYFNKLVRFNLFTHEFDTIPLKGDEIDPRFFASMGHTAPTSVSGDTLYLYGGKGNHEGMQDLGVKYYYDCYQINLKDSTVRLLWNQTPPERERVPARTLLVDAKAGYMYAMMYPEYRPNSLLQLYRISISDGSETAVGDSIPMISEEIATNVALYMPEGEDLIYCVVQEFEKEGATTTRIYSIAAPPVSAAELKAYDNGNSTSVWRWLWIVLTGIGVIGIVAIGLIFVRRIRSKKCNSDCRIDDEHPSAVEKRGEISGDGSAAMDSLAAIGTTQASTTTSESTITPASTTTSDTIITTESGTASETDTSLENVTSSDNNIASEKATSSDYIISPYIDNNSEYIQDLRNHRLPPAVRVSRPELPRNDRISMFGTFTAISARGFDASHLFTPKLRAIFIYLLMGTWRKGGISSSELSAVFWPDKDPDKIKNLRNVTIAKLRKVLADFSNLEIIHENGKFTVRCGEECYVDVDRLFRLTDNLHTEPSNIEAREEVEAIILQGKFMQGVESIELDDYKSAVEAFTLDVMLLAIERYTTLQHWGEVIKFSHLALLVDPVNEEAMRCGIRAYEAIGNKTRARSLYENFAVAYRKIYGEGYTGR